MTQLPPPSVAVIGAGPGGMLFCHALERHRRELKDKGDEAALANLPSVTCFDRASGPGGLWRFEHTTTSPPDTAAEGNANFKGNDKPSMHSSNMYEALWTNSPKEGIEFFDYTYDEHFGGHALPVYLPRQAMFEYLTGRVTKHCPDFFERYMKFNTSVESVRFMEERNKFEIVTKDMLTGETIMEGYDKCIWAAGMNGRPMMPESLMRTLREGGFSGRIVHSSDTANFEEDVKEKTILLIGGSFSGEDLALTAVKCGVRKVYISSRNDNVVSWTGAWPYNKVEVLEGQLPIRVTENGRCIQFAAAECVQSEDYVPGEEEVQTELRDVDTIIFCTGYLPNVGMLGEDLKQALCRDENPELLIPKDWTMAPNSFTEVLGDIKPADDVKVFGSIYPGLYCGCISIQNPGMMFMAFEFENTLFGIDVSAWLLMRVVTGLRELPSAGDMLKKEKDAALHALNNPGFRCLMDKNYIEAVEENWENLPGRLQSKHEWLDEAQTDYEENMDVRMLARYIAEAEYPVNFGSVDELNETANAYMAFDRMTRDHRSQLTEEDAVDGKTYRDCSDGGDIVSIFTGTPAVPLKCRWLDADAGDSAILAP